ncbi:MAG TPA: phosphoribosylanthranilate isomerase [Thermodesulfobacteriota bacterium]|nr:phosphoribosylanthranilate isomerase [Thermodesulfobacteriota bacterium]
MLNNLIQIAGVINLEEALMLIDECIEYIGFPLRLKDGREDLSEQSAREIIKYIKPISKPVLITYQQNAKEISEFYEYLEVDIIQLHGHIKLEEVRNLKKLYPDLLIIKSLIVRNDNLEEITDEINMFSDFTDYFITDTFDPKTGRTGATGKTHDWEISRQIVNISPKPVILAGGLNPENVRDAINVVKPAGVDTHTGVENLSGKKDAELVKKFVSESQKGFNDLLNGDKD